VSNDPSLWVAALRGSQDRLAARAANLDGAEIRSPSYCPGWNIAQVYSHLGSQSVMFNRLVEAGVSGGDPPGQDAWTPIWDAWNSRTPEAQVEDCVTLNEELVRRLEALDADQMRAFRVAAFGMDLDLAGLLRLRLSEQAVHSWDIAVSFDPTALVSADAVTLLVDGLAPMVARVGKLRRPPLTLRVSTRDPERQFALVADGVRLEPWADQSAAGTLRLSAEALLRLVYGRLDSEHTPQVELAAADIDLDDLRAMFPGV